MEKVREENEKKLEDEKKNFEANTKSHETELQSKQDVSIGFSLSCWTLQKGAEFLKQFWKSRIVP